MRRAKRSSRFFALLLTLLLTIQCVPVASVWAASAAEDATVLPDYIFTEEWNQEYDVLYHEVGKSYTYQGKEVTFPDANTVKAGDTAYTIKNEETTVTTTTENGKTTVSFTNLKTPVGGISGEWNSGFAGRFAIRYQMNGKDVTSEEGDRLVTSITVDTPEDGTYTLTGGKIFEAANEWSPGHDFGQGVVAERAFGYLPDVTIVVGDSQEPTPPAEKPVPEITATIGDQALTITEVDNGGYPIRCQVQHTYQISVPEKFKGEQITITGLEGYNYREVKSAESCWGSLTKAWPVDVAVNEFGYHLQDLRDQYAAGYKDLHIIFEIVPDESVDPEPNKPAENAPFTAKLNGEVLVVEDAGQVYCEHTDGYFNGPEGTVQGYYVVLPAGSDAKQFIYNGEGADIATNNCSEYGIFTFDNEDETLDVLADNGFYHCISGSTVFHIAFRHEEDTASKITVTARDMQLQVEKVYGKNAYLVHVPAAVKGDTVSVNGLDGYHYESVETAQSGDINGVWEAKILKNGQEYKLTNDSGKELFLLFDREQAASVDVRFNAQMDGAFMLPPMSTANVEAGLAGFYGYTYDKSIGKDDVTVLDALVKMHQLVFGEEDVTPYLTVTETGFITKAFGVETSALGFAVDDIMPMTTANQTILQTGDTFTFFNYQDTSSYGDKIVWLEQNGEKLTHFDAAVHTPLALTVKSADWSGNVTPVSGVQLALVDENGNITPVKSAVTNEQGTASITFATPGTYTITVISGETTKVVMPIAYVSVNQGMVSLSVEARTAGKGDLIPMTTLPIMEDGCTVKDILDALAAENDLSVEYSEQGAILHIGDLGINEQGGGWRCYLNGKTMPQSAQKQTVQADDVIRIRYAVSATGSELDAPLYQYLQTRTEQAKAKLLDNYTESSKRVLQAAIDKAEAILADSENNSTETNQELLVSDGVAALNLAEAELVMGDGGSTADPSIPDDFENDLWLQYDFKELKIGETAKIYPRRIPQIIDDPINNTIMRPNFHFDVVRGSSVTLSGNESTESVSVTAVRDGVTIVKVTYDACGSYGASSPINTAYVVFQVNSDPANLEITTSLSALRSYDTIYYAEGDTVPYTFSVDVPGAETVEVTCNDQVLTANEDGTYTADLENRSNILGIEAFDANGKVKSYYQVVDARKIQITVQNLTNPGQPFKINDRAKVSFRGITMPVSKLATIYNPCFGADASQWGNEATYVHYQNEKLGEFKGHCSQWDLATNNSFEVLLTEAGDYTFTGGNIHAYWWGDPLGSDKIKEGKGDANLGADTHNDVFSMLPDFTIKVEEEVSNHVPVSGITLNETELTLKEGESFQLTANVLPEDASNQNFTWRLSNGTGYFITMDENGKITAHHANHENVPYVFVIVTTEEGDFTAKCKVTVVKAEEPAPETTVLHGGDLTVAAPVAGNTPAQAATQDTGYKIVSTTWNPGHKTFAANTAYRVEIVLEAQDGTFAKDAVFTINGKAAQVKTNTGDQVTITLDFDAKGNPVVPQTGDNSLMTLWCTMGAISLLGAAALIRMNPARRKQNREAK